MQELLGGTLNNRYRIDTVLGEGGMGVVFKGFDVTLQRSVAIKTMHTSYARQPNFRSRFLLEARTAARLDHPGVVKVYDFGEQQDTLFIIMEFIDGINLQQKLDELRSQRQRLSLIEAVQIVRQIALALDYTHKQGILHRDIKPANIMLKQEASEGLRFRPVLTDLGLARLIDSQRLTQVGTSIGTPTYMAPEQALGEPTDARADVYSLGILLYELAVGQTPFQAETSADAAMFHQRSRIPTPRSLRPDLSGSVEKVILEATERTPDKRYASAGALAEALGQLAGYLAKQPSPPPAKAPPAAKPESRPPKLVSTPSRVEEAGKPPTAGGDYVRIEAPDSMPISVPVQSNEMVLGRGKDVDISLNSTSVSRKHVKLSFDGKNYYLTDLNSGNGTYMDESRLLAGVRELWSPDKVVHIGAFSLFLVRGTKSRPPIPPSRPKTQIFDDEGKAVDPRFVHISPDDGRIGVVLGEENLTVATGQSVILPVILSNQGELVDHFRVAVEGVPERWVSVQPVGANLMPGRQATITITITPPREPASASGEYEIKVGVTSRESPRLLVKAPAVLSVQPYIKFASELHPQKVGTGQTARITLSNQGNRTETFHLNLKDRADEIAFEARQDKLEVPAGQKGALDFYPRLRRFRWFGAKQSHAFNAAVSVVPVKSNEISVPAVPVPEPQTHQGEVISKGLIPAWLPLVMVALCALLVFSIPPLIGMFAEPTPTLIPVVVNATPTLPFTIATAPPVALESTPTPELSPTPEPFCPGAPPMRVEKGIMVRVITDDEILYVRSSPQILPGNANIIGEFLHGVELQVLNGPDEDVFACYTIDEERNQRVIFWRIRIPEGTFRDGSTIGWVAEGDSIEYYIEPLD